jgi:hypothetical protein
VKDLAIDGRDVIDLLRTNGLVPPGYRGDRRVGHILRTLFERVTDEPGRNNRDVLLEMAQELIAAGE